jgi:hypothetical protein
MKYVVNVSGGVPSAIALRRTIEKHGKDNTTAVFADVKIEDADLYRFLDDVENFLDFKITRICEGRTPWQVFFDEKMMGNSKVDHCSRILKREFIDKWIKESGFTPENCIRVFGFGLKEIHRSENIRAAVHPFRVWLPLHEGKILSNCECIEHVRNEWGIDPPELYDDGFHPEIPIHGFFNVGQLVCIYLRPNHHTHNFFVVLGHCARKSFIAFRLQGFFQFIRFFGITQTRDLQYPCGG